LRKGGNLLGQPRAATAGRPARDAPAELGGACRNGLPFPPSVARGAAEERFTTQCEMAVGDGERFRSQVPEARGQRPNVRSGRGQVCGFLASGLWLLVVGLWFLVFTIGFCPESCGELSAIKRRLGRIGKTAVGRARRVFHEEFVGRTIPENAVGGVPTSALPPWAQIAEHKLAAFDFDVVEKHAGGPAFNGAAVVGDVGG